MHLLDGYDFILIDLSTFVFFVTLTFLFLGFMDFIEVLRSREYFFEYLKIVLKKVLSSESTQKRKLIFYSD